MFLKIRKLFSLTSTCCQMYDKDFGNIHYTFLLSDIFRKERRKKILHHAWEEVPLGNKGKTSIDVILMKLVTSNVTVRKNYDNSITIKEDLDKNQPVRVC